MGSVQQDFLIAYEFDDDDRPLIIEDDGSACHAHVRGPTGNVVSEVWLYNRVAVSEKSGAQSLAKDAAPTNPGTHTFDWGESPLPSSAADFRVSISKVTNKPTVFSIFIRGEPFAILRVGEKIGRCKLAKKDGPLARRLPRPGEAYWQVVDPYWEHVDIYNGAVDFRRTFAQVPEAEGDLLALHWCQSEVCNGGFHQFFRNSTGVLAPEAAKGFRAIDMPVVAEIVERAMAMFGVPYPREWEERRQSLSKLAGKTGDEGDRDTWDPFKVLDDGFYDAIAEDVLCDAADAYAARTMPLQAQLNLTPQPQVDGKICYASLPA